MLVRFGVENYKSFNEMTYLEMIAGTQNKKEEYLLKNKCNKLLRFVALYGANASGKSNLVDAMYFARKTISYGLENEVTIKNTFRFDENSVSTFSFHIIVDGEYYVYSISIDMIRKVFVNEKLDVYSNTDKEYNLIFSREESTIKYDKEIFKGFEDRLEIYKNDFMKSDKSGIKTFLQELTSKDLSESKVLFIKKIFESFNLMVIIKDDTLFSRELIMQLSNDGYSNILNEQSSLVTGFDTGISKIDMIDLSYEEFISLEGKEFVERHVAKAQNVQTKNLNQTIRSRFTENVYSLRIKETKLKIEKLKYMHNGVEFDYKEESTGTKKIIDLSSIFLFDDLVVVIDEIDRSFHHNLTVEFINKFISMTKTSQLIVTTHDPLLMDQKKFRRDSFWFVDRNKKNESVLYPLEQFKPRFDKVLYKDYLAGRYNAVPCLKEVEDEK